jgi:hypothetical protein
MLDVQPGLARARAHIQLRLTDGFLSGKAVHRCRFSIPVRDHRVQVLDDDGLAALIEHLREFTGAPLGSLIRATLNRMWLDDLHRTKA